ncbi:sn-glycerol-3-phosphate ABC transporter ATP-binding protein UgpC [Lutimaribacter sp. EGI FJ00015]|uniref:Sn-glycerol-3-phosphate ABC transporter ATP-binding protein UgpC n=1 Tax=Lutimaribacter degradans TaxID=2945989 RepID=A0ACC5ZU92_9RHOB|nr:sn-glycerol-3-phosphate ABC transporter ATP-binding protein UgpC [Lutimaribacter sp. EGI FJ00013]MCM2561642.1 sn-glycerol-3-phosphate ABC transporter ATP-binding protein UgpC [Lutimaribacter sp. EGI FJ00013]MCO0612647.1 sn-glycerol-3-phosphate ABC transporter ATP-binding protein UgpC [Lutimaribacter sp. EGI FJ00015]MCO0635305.1 sn-glycerol-3-phosphate ABC transporter ATP-binding protein UgpC [Lutimaribacter sp. EGI FJ00014]
MANLKLDRVGKTYAGGVSAVENASFEIADGEFIVLVGPSGCGKSTMLRMIAGLEEITDGDVQIGDRSVNGVEPGDRNIAMVFQNYALYPHMTVRGNMAYGLRNQGMPKPEVEARIAEAARFLQLEPYLDRKPSALSGGQRQRVAMGRAIVREPSVFLFDEPLSNLDAKLRTQLRAELKDLHKRLGATFIYVTHDQIEAMSLADRIVIMSAGRIEQIGTPMELYANPASTFVAEFIGAPPMNVLPVTGEAARAFLAQEARVPDDLGHVGIRPELMSIGDNGIPATITLVEPLGAETLVHLKMGADKLIMRSGHGLALDAGAEIKVAVEAGALRFFDRDGRTRSA